MVMHRDYGIKELDHFSKIIGIEIKKKIIEKRKIYGKRKGTLVRNDSTSKKFVIVFKIFYPICLKEKILIHGKNISKK